MPKVVFWFQTLKIFLYNVSNSNELLKYSNKIFLLKPKMIGSY